MSRLLIASVVLMILGCSSEDRPPDGPPAVVAVGQSLPTLSSVLVSGDSVFLRFPAPAPVVLQLGAFGCSICRDQWPLLDSLQRKWGTASVRIVVLTIDERRAGARLERWAESDSSMFEVWRDPDRAIANMVGVEGLPQIVVIGRDGVVIRRQLGLSKGSIPRWVHAVDSLLRTP